MGFLLIIVSQVLGPDEDAAAQGRRLESHNPLGRPRAVRAEDRSFAVRLPYYEDPIESADTRIDGLAGELPSDVEEEQIRREGAGGGPHSSDQERALLRWSLLGLFSS